MKIIIPMAGRGTRLRPHTLTTPKPLIPIAGKPIVHRLVEDLVKVCNEPVEEVCFIIGDFNDEIKASLIKIAESIGAKGTIKHQEKALGTAHAIWCAEECLSGKVLVAFADTLFNASFKLDTEQDSIIWVHKVEDPSAFGVVKLGQDNIITDFVEKPEDYVSDLAIIGIYYFKDGKNLQSELQYLIENEIKVGKEFQLTTALENMKNKGLKFVPGQVTEWLDCGNKDAVVNTNQRYLEYIKDQEIISSTAVVKNSVLIEPVYLGENVQITNAVVGPHVSIGSNSIIENSIVSNSIVQEESKIQNANIKSSMLGSKVYYEGVAQNVSIGDYNLIKP
jgi:glucose-1-phosphate thymidylyltransferase